MGLMVYVYTNIYAVGLLLLTCTFVFVECTTELSEELVAAAQGVVNSLQVLEVVTPALHASLNSQLLSLLPSLLACLCCSFTAVRHMAARCVAAVTQVDLHHCMLVS